MNKEENAKNARKYFVRKGDLIIEVIAKPEEGLVIARSVNTEVTGIDRVDYLVSKMSGIARLNPEDEFNMKIGSAIAISRLLKRVKAEIINDNNNMMKRVTAFFDNITDGYMNRIPKNCRPKRK